MRCFPSVWRNADVELLRCYEQPVDHRVASRSCHVHVNHIAWLIRRGTATLRSGADDELHLRIGQWVFIPPRIVRSQTFSADAVIVSLHFRAQWGSAMPLFTYRRPLVIEAADQPALDRRAVRLVALCDRPDREKGILDTGAQPSDRDRQRIQSAFSQWLVAWSDALTAAGIVPTRNPFHDRRIARVVFFLNRLPYCSPLPYDQICALAGVGRVQVDRLFVAAIGITPRQYHEQVLLEQAFALLTDTGWTVKRVCMELGFGSMSHFSRWFSRLAHMPPRRYRNRDRRWPEDR